MTGPTDPAAQARIDIDLLTALLIAEITDAWDALSTAEAELVGTYLTAGPAERQRLSAQLLTLADRLMGRVDGVARSQIGAVLHGAYEAGAIRTAAYLDVAASFTGDDVDVLSQAARDTYADVLAATRHVTDTTKQLVRFLAREAADARYAGGLTAAQAGRLFSAAAAGHGIAAIVYRDGSRHGLREYGQMLLRTKTAETYQEGGFVQAERLGVTFMELLDNPSCGLTSHDDPLKANGLVLPLAEARRWPISHPNCVRATTPRVDIHTLEEARRASPSSTPGQNADQRAVELARQQAVVRRAARTLAQRTSRTAGGRLDLKAGAARSAAARRHASHVARRRTPAGSAWPKAATASTALVDRAQLTAREAGALRNYTDAGYKVVNAALRSGQVEGAVQEQVGVIDSVLRRYALTEDTTVRRALDASAFGLGKSSDVGSLIGRVFTDKGYMSTTAGRTFATHINYRQPVEMRMRVPQGTPAAGLEGLTVSSGELEILLGRGLTYRVDAAYFDELINRWTVDVSVVPE